MAELTDVTPTGLAVGTAVDAKAGRAALVAERDFQFNVLDYGVVGDGVVDDLAAIKTAVLAAASKGGVVFFPAGVYRVSNSIEVKSPNVTIQGAGRSATVISTTANKPIILGQNAPGLVVRDLQLRGDGDPAKGAQMGLLWTDVADGLVHNVWVKDIGYDGICLLWGCTRCVVSNNLVTGCKDDGINIGGHPSVLSEHNVVSGNVVRGSGNVGIHISLNSQFSSVTGNVVADCGTNGIDTFQSGDQIGMGGNSITGNVCQGNGKYGIYLFNSDDNVMSGNKIADSGEKSIYVNRSYRSVISNNQCTGSAETASGGVYADTGSQDMIVSGNMFSGAGGVYLLSPRTNFTGNRILGATAPAVVVAAQDCVVTDSIISDSTGIGINVTAQRCVVSDNRVQTGAEGVRLAAGSNQSVVNGNVITGGTNGVLVSSNDCVVGSNICDGQTSLGINVNGGNDTVVSGNSVKASVTYGIQVGGASARTQVIGNHINATPRAVQITGTASGTLVSGNITTGTTGTNSISEGGTCTGTVVAHNVLDKTPFLASTGGTVYRELGADHVNNGLEYGAVNNFQRSAWRQVKATFTAPTGASLTATNLIPDGALLLGVTARTNLALGATAGLTGYTVGDGSDPDLWGAVTSVGVSRGLSSRDYTDPAAAGRLYTSPQSVVITATGGTFDGTGEIELVAHYMTCESSGVSAVLLDKVEDVVEDLNPITTLEGEPVATTLEGQVPVEIKPAAKKRRTTK
jgi:parallel beta-helix repeat protein